MKLLQQLLLQRRLYISCLCSRQLVCKPLPRIHQTAQNHCMSQHSILKRCGSSLACPCQMQDAQKCCTSLTRCMLSQFSQIVKNYQQLQPALKLRVVWSESWHNLVRMMAKADRAAWLTMGSAARTHSSVTAVWLGSSRSRRDTASSPVRLTVTCSQPTVLCTTTTCYYYLLLLLLLLIATASSSTRCRTTLC